MSTQLTPLDDDLRLVEPIGAGASADVWSAVQLGTERLVAVKVRRERMDDAEPLGGSFRREAQLMARVAHPNIVPILRHGSLRGQPALVLQHVDGVDLAQLIEMLRSRPDLPSPSVVADALGVESVPGIDHAAWWRTSASFLRDIARALDHAHSCGVVHRDVKPANMLFDRSGLVQLTDFGIAAIDGEPVSDSSGSLAYIAPERLTGAPPSVRSDVYSLGASLRELTTLERPLRATTVAGAIREIDAERRAVRSRSMPRDLTAIVERAMAHDPLRRYGTAADFARDLEAALAGRPIVARAEGTLRRLWRTARHHRVAVAMVASSVAVGALALTAVAWQGERSARRIHRSAELSEEALEIALDGLADVIVSASADETKVLPWFDRTRADALRVGIDLGDALIKDGLVDDGMVARIEAVRGEAWVGLATVERRLGNLRAAQAHLAEADRVAQRTAPEDARRIRARAAHSAMTIAASTGDLEASEAAATRACELICTAPNTPPDMVMFRASVWGTLSECMHRQGKVERALECANHAVEAARVLLLSGAPRSQELGSIEFARSQVARAAPLLKLGRHAEARAAALEGLDVLNALPQFESATRTIRTLSWNHIGASYRAQKRHGAALAAYRNSLELQLYAVEETPDWSDARYRVAEARFRIAQTLLSDPSLDAGGTGTSAVTEMEASIAQLERITSDESGSVGAFQLKMYVHRLHARFDYDAGRFGAAVDRYRAAAEAQDRVVRLMGGAESATGGRRTLCRWWMSSVIRSRAPDAAADGVEECVERFAADPLIALDAACMVARLGDQAVSGLSGATESQRAALRARALGLHGRALALLQLAAGAGLDDARALREMPALASVRLLPGFDALTAGMSNQ